MKVLCRYDTQERIEKFINDGVLSFGNARLYVAQQLTGGQRDNELRRTFYPSPKNGIVVFTPQNGTPPIHVEVVGMKLESLLPHYFLFCLSTVYDVCLYEEFGRDACAVIGDPGRFLKRLRDHVSANMPGWKVGCRGVKYFDPRHTPETNDLFDLICSKDQRYKHQYEYRIVLYTREETDAERIPVCLGALEDDCDITMRLRPTLSAPVSDSGQIS